LRLIATAGTNWPGYDGVKAGAGTLDIYAAVQGTSTASANTGLTASQMLWSGDDPVAWESVSWNSVSWNSVSWNSVSWNSVSWNSEIWDDEVVAVSQVAPLLTDGTATPDNSGVETADEQNHSLFLPLVSR